MQELVIRDDGSCFFAVTNGTLKQEKAVALSDVLSVMRDVHFPNQDPIFLPRHARLVMPAGLNSILVAQEYEPRITEICYGHKSEPVIVEPGEDDYDYGYAMGQGYFECYGDDEECYGGCQDCDDARWGAYKLEIPANLQYYTIPVPRALSVVIGVKEEGRFVVQQFRLFALKESLTSSSYLYQYPLGNIYNAGIVCMGNNLVSGRPLESASVLYELYLKSPFNGDLPLLNAADLDPESLFINLNGKEEFPPELLVGVGTLTEVLNSLL